MMTKYLVSGTVTISIHKVVDAKSKKAAMQWAAENLGMPGLCWQCSRAGKGDDDTWEISGELDGEGKSLDAEKVKP